MVWLCVESHCAAALDERQALLSFLPDHRMQRFGEVIRQTDGELMKRSGGQLKKRVGNIKAGFCGVRPLLRIAPHRTKQRHKEADLSFHRSLLKDIKDKN